MLRSNRFKLGANAFFHHNALSINAVVDIVIGSGTQRFNNLTDIQMFFDFFYSCYRSSIQTRHTRTSVCG